MLQALTSYTMSKPEKALKKLYGALFTKWPLKLFQRVRWMLPRFASPAIQFVKSTN